jgi:hypothetical protein
MTFMAFTTVFDSNSYWERDGIFLWTADVEALRRRMQPHQGASRSWFFNRKYYTA